MDEDYLEAVLDVVGAIPPGRAMTYGLVAEVVQDRLVASGLPARGGPRQVGQVMARGGSGVPWWRVVNAAGSPPAHHAVAALERLREEGTPLTADGTRVALRRAVWFPDDPPAGDPPAGDPPAG
ncbi:MGMT family protein [Cellulomonas sp. ES6]|uniref:MGMT family protein n=1 Tax=Cellulomonas sp. ES6 TaxID=3039384 RepID=UPI0024B7286E|nr:MGMT family protein [Cellulomonas sp. ES6]WHP18317.1 MGMT family protein [Cellulomonas sp. ES6]